MDFVDLKSQQARIRDDLERRIAAVLDHGHYIMGPEVGQLEARLAQLVGVRHVVGCSSGTDALLLPLMAHGVGPGDAVFTTTFTFMATAEVVSLLGASPVFVDIDPRTFNIDVAALRSAIERVRRDGRLRPRGIIPVDLFGLPADLDPIMTLASELGLFVIEDAAQSLGGEYRGRKAGALAHVGTTSFFPAKVLGCYGDGGAIFTDDDELADRMRSIRVHGMGRDKYSNVRIGLNARLDTLQAAILLAKLEIFEDEIRSRREVAAHYGSALAEVVDIPVEPAGFRSAWGYYSILCRNRDDVQRRLSQAGIPSVVYYPTPLHRQPAFSGMDHGASGFPVAERTARTILSLPMHPYLTRLQIDQITEVVRQAVPTAR